MRRRSWRDALLGLGLGSSFGPIGACELPPLEYESEHALLGTDQVDEVCAGSLARIDQTIEYVDAELGRETDAEPAIIYVLDVDEVAKRCTDQYIGACVERDGTVLLSTARYEEALTHELVHERVKRTAAAGTKPFFNEGIATALGHARRPPGDEHQPPSVDSLLQARASIELHDFSRSYYHAGELIHWLIETQGMARVLDFMAGLERRDSPDEVRKTYAAYFGGSIDEQLFVHAREEADMTRHNVSCTGPELARDPERPRFRLDASLACDSPRVENIWSTRDRGFVEWVIRVGEDERGPWAPVRVTGDGTIPSGTKLEIRSCLREKRIRGTWSNQRNPGLILTPGLYRVRWIGELDAATRLEIELGGPCDPEAPNCGPGQRCVSRGICLPSL